MEMRIEMGQAEQEDVLILAIESSCDETAAAVVKNGREVLSNVIYKVRRRRTGNRIQKAY